MLEPDMGHRRKLAFWRPYGDGVSPPFLSHPWERGTLGCGHSATYALAGTPSRDEGVGRDEQGGFVKTNPEPPPIISGSFLCALE